MNKIVKYNEYDLNEGVRDLMTPKSPEGIRDKIDEIITNPEGIHLWDAMNVLNKLKDAQILTYLTEEEGKRIAELALSDEKLMSHVATGKQDNILWFMNRYGGGKYFINLDNGRIHEIDGPGAGEAAKMLKEIL